ncbi:MAG: branched-chain amino acid transport system II carrier protein [Candidatus Niameybacter stercoravium]|nr:branched-chain amino acid transport system II carrier protein [Candidatus Niameybacter stercoravium]
MKKHNTMKDIIIIGFALFAMFFGSGNLIFPPYLGRLVGEQYVTAMIGFMIMGVGLPLLGVMATAKAGGSFDEAGNKVGKTFSIVLMTALILAIGPFLAIPRTAATTFEISIRPFLPSVSPVIIIAIYFGINLFFVLSPNSIVDIIGKFLTPALLITLLILIVKGVLVPVGTLTNNTLPNTFTASLIEGYQTMDALAAVCFGGIIVTTIKSKGYTSTNEVIKMTLKSSLIAIGGLGIIYGGLMYLGAHTTNLVGEIEKTALVITLAKQILGSAGTVFLAVAVALACLTTSIGLTTTGATYFSNLSRGKLSYKAAAILISVLSMAIALLGVDHIVGLTTPILKILYPIIIVLVLLTLIGKYASSSCVYKVTVYVTLVVVLIDVLGKLFNITVLQRLISYLPLSSVDFAWLVPALLAFAVSKLLLCKKEKTA